MVAHRKDLTLPTCPQVPVGIIYNKHLNICSFKTLVLLALSRELPRNLVFLILHARLGNALVQS